MVCYVVFLQHQAICYNVPTAILTLVCYALRLLAIAIRLDCDIVPGQGR
jgi:hypothetical protein